jgi:plastocyanin
MWKGLALLFAGALFVASCGKSDDSPSSPTPNPDPTPGAATITITANGVSPRSVTVSLGSRVTFVNNDSRSHDMSSNPHPDHTDCPPINQVGLLQPGQTRTSGNFTVARTCGFHDHNLPTNTTLQGTIVIQ